MALNAANVKVGITGELFVAPIGTSRPTSATDSLDGAYVGLGYVSEDGVTEAHEDSVDNIVAWQNSTIVRAVRTASLMTLSCTLIETKGSVLELFHPGATIESDGATGWKLEVPTPEIARRQFALNVVDGAKVMRIDIGNGEITSRGEVTYGSSDAVGYQITITCYPDENGLLCVKYSNDPAWSYS